MYIDSDTLLFWIVVVVAVSAFAGFERGKRRGKEERNAEIERQLEDAIIAQNLPVLLGALPEKLRVKYFAELQKMRDMQ